MGGLGRRAAAMAAAWILAASATASAGMMGCEATSQYYAYGSTSGAARVFTVDGLAHGRTYNTFEVVVTSSQIIYDFGVALSSGTWSPSSTSLDRDGLRIRNGNLLSFEGAPRIVGVTIDAATTMVGLTAGAISFNDAAVAIDWMGMSYNRGTRVVLNVTTAAPAAVSEPPALAMAGLATLGLAGAAVRRRRRGAQVA